MTVEAPAAVELRGLTKQFGSVLANAGVNLRVEAGTIHDVIGENGVGKSPAMKILYGMLRLDAGEILIGGKKCVWASPSDAIVQDIGNTGAIPSQHAGIARAVRPRLPQDPHLPC